jgi:DNA-binding NarL/FixJ family response regulator
MTISALLIDELPLLRVGIRTVCDGVSDIQVVGESGRPADAGPLADELGPDVVILGLRPPGQSGVEVIRMLRRRVPPVPVLALTAPEHDALLAAAIRAGVRGCLASGSPADDLVYAVRMVVAGHVVLAGELAERLTPLFDGFGISGERVVLRCLSPREQETLRLLAQGYDNRRIARELTLAEKTVRNHVSNIMAKLGVPSRAAAVAVAWGTGEAG